MVASLRRSPRATKILLSTVWRERYLLGFYSITLLSYAEAARTLHTNRGRAFYWTKKLLDPTWRSNTHGGRRRGTFTQDELKTINQRILQYLQSRPSASLNSVTEFLSRAYNRRVSKSVTQRLLKKLGWSWRIPTGFQIQKYTLRNMARYLDYIRGIQKIPPPKIKFLDEAHIVSKDLHKKKVIVSSLIQKNHKSCFHPSLLFSHLSRPPSCLLLLPLLLSIFLTHRKTGSWCCWQANVPPKINTAWTFGICHTPHLSEPCLACCLWLSHSKQHTVGLFLLCPMVLCKQFSCGWWLPCRRQCCGTCRMWFHHSVEDLTGGLQRTSYLPSRIQSWAQSMWACLQCNEDTHPKQARRKEGDYPCCNHSTYINHSRQDDWFLPPLHLSPNFTTRIHTVTVVNKCNHEDTLLPFLAS